MNVQPLPAPLAGELLAAGWSVSEVAEMHLCECGSLEEAAMYQPRLHPVKVCGSCWESGHWM
jgi:hypothetical protein